MPRVRLAVALLLPAPAAAEIVGLQRGLGSPLRVPPHVTLVPPVNVAIDRLDDITALLRQAAATVPPLRLALGPTATFWPDTPVVYLTVGGDLEEVRRLREILRSGPFDRPSPWPFVPHVTLTEDIDPELIPGLVTVLGRFHADISVERVHLLQQRETRVWEPIADAPLGGGRVVGRGGIEVDVAVGDVLAPDAAAFFDRVWAGHLERSDPGSRPGRSFAVTARSEGVVAGVALGRCDDELWLDRLIVEPATRGRGFGTRLLTEVELTGAASGCRRGYLVCRSRSPAEAWYAARGWRKDLALRAWRHGSDFVRMMRDLPG